MCSGVMRILTCHFSIISSWTLRCRSLYITLTPFRSPWMMLGLDSCKYSRPSAISKIYIFSFKNNQSNFGMGYSPKVHDPHPVSFVKIGLYCHSPSMVKQDTLQNARCSDGTHHKREEHWGGIAVAMSQPPPKTPTVYKVNK